MNYIYKDFILFIFKDYKKKAIKIFDVNRDHYIEKYKNINYTSPIVDYKKARERSLKMYKK